MSNDPQEMKIGMAVKYVDARRPDEPRDALVQIIFACNGREPHLTLLLVRPGERGTTIKSYVPHRTVRRDEPGWWKRADDDDIPF